MEIQWIFATILAIIIAIIMLPICIWGLIDTTKAIIQNIKDIRKSLGMGAKNETLDKKPRA